MKKSLNAIVLKTADKQTGYMIPIQKLNKAKITGTIEDIVEGYKLFIILNVKNVEDVIENNYALPNYLRYAFGEIKIYVEEDEIEKNYLKQGDAIEMYVSAKGGFYPGLGVMISYHGNNIERI